MEDYRPEASILGKHIEAGLKAIGTGIREGLEAIREAK